MPAWGLELESTEHVVLINTEGEVPQVDAV